MPVQPGMSGMAVIAPCMLAAGLLPTSGAPGHRYAAAACCMNSMLSMATNAVKKRVARLIFINVL